MASLSSPGRIYKLEMDPRPGVGVRCVAVRAMPAAVTVLLECPVASTDSQVSARQCACVRACVRVCVCDCAVSDF